MPTDSSPRGVHGKGARSARQADARRTSEGFGVRERDTLGVRIFALRGELDLASAPALCGRLYAAVQEDHRHVVVDLSAASHWSPAGVRALIGASREVLAHAGRIAVVAPDTGRVARLLALTGVGEALPLYARIEDAVAAAKRRPVG